VEKGFNVLDHTADIGIVAYGNNIEALFSNAATGLFSLMTDLDTIKDVDQKLIELTAEDPEILLVEWLNELIYIFEVDHIVFKRFEIEELTENRIKARCYGQHINPKHSKLEREIKAATYHMLKISKGDNGYQVTIIFDI
jgi:SHS2 domain-containing protein